MTQSSAQNVVSLLENAADRQPSRIALAGGRGGKALTFSELYARLSKASTGFERQGLKSGERAIIMVPMSADLYVLLLGLLKMGGIGVFVDPWIPLRQIAAFCAFAEPRAFIGIAKSQVLRLMHAELRAIPLSITTSSRLGRIPARVTLAELLQSEAGLRVQPCLPDTPALITFTTGSSGIPKGANRTHGFLHAQYVALQHEFPYLDEDVEMTMFPVFALNNLARGITTVIPDMEFGKVGEVVPETIMRQIAEHGVKTITASPPFFDRLAAYLSEKKKRLVLRRILVGGAAISNKQITRWREAFGETEIVLVYGSTEAEPTAHISAEERLKRQPDASRGICMGKVTSLCDAKVIAITRGEIAHDGSSLATFQLNLGEVGELTVSGAHVCRDYFKNPNAVRENKIALDDGTVWHRMGDTGYFDDEGYFWLTGRVHSTISRAGKHFHAQLIEQRVLEVMPAVTRAAAIGLPDKQLGEKLCLVLETQAPPAEHAALESASRKALQQTAPELDLVIIRAKPFPLDPRHNSKIRYEDLRKEIINTLGRG